MRRLDPRRQQLQAAFSTELEERVGALTRLLQTLEHDGHSEHACADTFDALFREAHSLKGAARAVELVAVERWAHEFETALGAARQRGERLGRAWFDAAYHAVDTFNDLVAHGDGTALPSFPDILAPERPTPADPGHDLRPGQRAESSPREPTAPAGQSRLLTEAARAGSSGAQDSAESIRVSVSKLDTLLAQAGELAVTRIRIGQRLEELHDLEHNLYDWRRDWRDWRSLRATVRRASAVADHGAPVPTRYHSAAVPTRDLDALPCFTERAEDHAQAVYRQVEELAAQLRRDFAQLGFVTQGIADEVLALRLLPVATIFGPFERMVRDLARGQGKDIHLLLDGNEVESDRKILEQLRDPLMHMVRNAVDHGIERPDERAARGKPRSGTIRLTALQRRGAVEIDVEDDGTGLDPTRLRQSAIEKGLLSHNEAAALDDQAAMELIFQPGFSTSATVTETSGRGVGMDVVSAHVERLNGQVGLSSTPGRGTRFTIRVPLTLATTRAILVAQSGQIFAIPSAMIERNARVREQFLVSLEGRRAVVIDGHPVPIVELADALEQARTAASGQDAACWRPFFVLRQDDRRVALLADGLLGEQEIVVKMLGWRLRRVRNVGGAAVLGSGQTVAILNPFDLLKTALKLVGGKAKPVALVPAAAPSASQRRHVLVVDDSLPTRMLVRSILTVDLLFQTIDVLRGLVGQATPGSITSDSAVMTLATALREQVSGRAGAVVADDSTLSPASGKPRALLVDDSATVQMLGTMLLEEAGFDVNALADGSEALALALTHAFDLVVSGVEARGLRGWDLAESLRNVTSRRSVPIIVMSCDETPEGHERAAALGVHAYLQKGSLERQRLVEVARAALEGRAA